MPVTMTWNVAAEKKPAHNQMIIWLKISSSFDSWGFDPREVTVEYQWSEVDEYGDTGSSVCYEEGDEPLEHHRLVIIVDGWELQETDLWMDVEDYDKFLMDNIPALKE